VLVLKDKDGELIHHYVCPECLGKTTTHWRTENSIREQFVEVTHLPACNTGIRHYNQVHNSQRKMN
jgi:hypothetical protein